MEEIIASISRIITDEKTSVEPVRPVPSDKSEILELTEVVDEDGSVRRVALEADAPERRPTGPAAAVDPTAANATARSGPGALPARAEVEPKLELGRERILSSATSGAAAAAFGFQGNGNLKAREPRGFGFFGQGCGSKEALSGGDAAGPTRPAEQA